MFFWLKKSVSFWLMPLPFCLTLLVMGLVLLWTRRARLGRGLLVTATLLSKVLAAPNIKLYNATACEDLIVKQDERRGGK